MGDPLIELAATSLPLRADMSRICDVPALHSDPFDRVLIAQAAAESLAFVTTDREIRRYASHRLRVIS